MQPICLFQFHFIHIVAFNLPAQIICAVCYACVFMYDVDVLMNVRRRTNTKYTAFLARA